MHAGSKSRGFDFWYSVELWSLSVQRYLSLIDRASQFLQPPYNNTYKEETEYT